MKYLSFFFVLFIGQMVTAQSDKLNFEEGISVNTKQYPDVAGSPYLFGGDWHAADLLGKDMKQIPDVPTRYNVHTGEFQVRQNDRYIRLLNEHFMRIEFSVDEAGAPLEEGAGKLIFQAGFHPRFQGRFVNMIYSGPMMVVFRDYRAVISKAQVQNVSNVGSKKQFYPRVDYYVLQGGELKVFRNTKKGAIKLLGHKKELSVFIEEQDINFNSARDLKKLFTFAETLD